MTFWSKSGYVCMYVSGRFSHPALLLANTLLKQKHGKGQRLGTVSVLFDRDSVRVPGQARIVNLINVHGVPLRSHVLSMSWR